MKVILSFGSVKLLTVENKVQDFEDLDHFRVKLEARSSVHDHMVRACR